MRIFIISLFFVCLGTTTMYGQQETKLFAQGLFKIEDREILLNVENTIKSISGIEAVRLDIPTQRFFILTGTAALSEEIVRSWFGTYAETLECIQIGVYGQDTMHPYPFTNCDD